jgi:uncharacterized UPF0160 family protein
MEPTVTIATHDGKFHPDEVIAICFLKKMHPTAKVIRTRDDDIIDQADFAVDVSLKFDPDSGRFDHHQFDFNEFFPGSRIPLSSAGLIWKTFGKKIIQMYASQMKEGIILTSRQLCELYRGIYNNIIKEIDANDNGINQYPESFNSKKLFNTNMSLIGTISKMNADNVTDNTIQLENFHKAVELCDIILRIHIEHHIERTMRFPIDLQATRDMVTHSKSIDPSGKILVASKYIHNVNKCLKEIGRYRSAIFIVSPGKPGEWNISCVPETNNEFRNKKDILPLEALEFLAPEIKDDLKFIHNKKYFAVTFSQQSAIKVAELSLSHTCRQSRYGKIELEIHPIVNHFQLNATELGNKTEWIDLETLTKIFQIHECSKKKGLELIMKSPVKLELHDTNGLNHLMTNNILRDFGFGN